MSTTPRQDAIRHISAGRPGSAAEAPREPFNLTEMFGSRVFNDAVQRRRLRPDVYQALRRTIDRGEQLDPRISDAVSDAMKDWAVEHGATHFTHWFQPMTGLTAEKHDSFLSPVVEGGAIHAFTGKELIKGEPDASSFPSGGTRSTFEARGYTAWDPTSPAFLRVTPYGTTLCIPTAFCSWTGEALDTKTPLLRSSEALDRSARRLLALIDERPERVFVTMGPEQEYFLIDRELYLLRPDLLVSGRSLFGARPPKGQELEDHYFRTTPERVLNFMMDLEHELWQLGVPVKTRHNEVAPHQFEMAPLYEQVSLATDHNMLAMELMQSVAERHGLACLLHEKPFAGVNGSGKHNNWSMADERGGNLLDPGHTPHENLRFILCLTAVIRAVDVHQDLLRVSIAHAANDHRLGANEAPPAILSIFLGSELEEIVEDLVSGGQAKSRARGHVQLGVTTLPPIPKDTSDRNRTSPFAFTGNKFEFRAVGSSQTIAYPNIFLNTAVSESFDVLSDEIEKRSKGGAERKAAIQEVVRETLKRHQRILFSGDNYSREWERESARRGLLNAKNTPDALALFPSEKNLALFERYAVLSRRETTARSNIFYSAYIHRIAVEALTMVQLASTALLPAGIAYQKQLADSINAARAAAPKAELGEQEKLLVELASTISRLRAALTHLKEAHAHLEEKPEAVAQSLHCRDQILPAMVELRAHADRLEGLVDDTLWPLPKYHELLFVH
ncbi:MAG: glutamine synthetase type III [Planctomycetes bacterium]|nr:glutamine synthetase type III [Planctomycetota bacterium]